MNTSHNFDDKISSLVRYVSTDEPAAWNGLFKQYKDKVYNFVLMTVKDRFVAEDISQETFIRILDTIRKKNYKEEGKFQAWIMRIAHNLCVDYFRQQVKVRVSSASHSHEMLAGIVHDEESPEEKLIKKQYHDRIQRMVNVLPEEQREVIVLKHYAELSFREIADLTDCSINTALGRMRYGLINLRKVVAR